MEINSGKYAFRPAAAVLSFVLLLLSAISCGRDGKIIPKGKMAEIYADMFIADQWINQNFKASKTADTTMVYEAIFRSYGYGEEDYRRSVDHYIQDPDRFARILRQSVLIIDERISEDRAELRKIRSLESMLPDSLIEFDFSRIWIFENGTPRLAGRDSLGYFRDRMEYFILDLQPLAEPDSSAVSLYFPADTVAASADSTASGRDTAFVARKDTVSIGN
ncbi:MAG: DUF4296 domain-containing protein [Bacteroidetes bacterium]|uniref:DUF4296 domain-containing protein n=1 Tax=Candidatus Cryptobacteroides merdigallinarum TaxID=2840770 RepID=A0A9D9EH19_9BACT|nr:DUF4296 domain-containing protein [Candidatus Cryptobacteroides merdigallinarum]